MCILNCDVARDLIPSYLDEICSEESKRAVEAHLSECGECRSHLETLKQMELSAEGIGQSQLDFMKRVKQYYARKNALGAALLFLFSLMVLPIIVMLHPRYEETLYCILFFSLAIGTYFLLSNYQTGPKGRWQKPLCGTLFALGILYPSCLMAVVIHCLHTGTGFFGMQLSETGPYFSAQLIAVVVAELLTFAVCAVDSVRKEYSIGPLPALNLTCCTLCMLYREILFHMDSQETLLYAVMRCAGLFLLVTAGVLVAELAVWLLCIHAAKRASGDI